MLEPGICTRWRGWFRSPREDTANQVLDTAPSSEHGLEVLRRERNHGRCDGRVPDTRFERSQDVAETFIRVSEDENCDLIILASHRSHHFERSNGTSFVEQVVRATAIPVLIEQGQHWVESRAAFRLTIANEMEGATLEFARSNTVR
jgi:nucleotide-binding universal stress UspA family protein